MFEIIGFISDLMGLSFRDEFPRLRAKRALRRAVRRAAVKTAAQIASSKPDRAAIAARFRSSLDGLSEEDFVDEYGNLVLRDTFARRFSDLDPDDIATVTVVRELYEGLLAEIGRQGVTGGTLESLHSRVQEARKAYFEAASDSAEVDFSGTGFGVPVSDEPLLGRDNDLEELLDHCRTAAGATIVWIHGDPGSGKSTLAAALACRLDDFGGKAVPFVRLRGAAKELSGAAYQGTDPMRVLSDLLRRYDVVGADRLPAAELRARWKTTIRQRNVQAVVLDDVRGIDQVEPFLPGDGHCVLIVTSRANPPGLLAHRWAIPPLPIEAVIGQVSGLNGSDSELLTRLVRGVSTVPLLLPLLRSLDLRPEQLLGALPPEILAADPSAAPQAGDLVATAHALVIDRLHPHLHRSLGMLAAQPGFRLTADNLAALDRISPEEAALRLEALVEAGLLKPGPDGSYGFHDRTLESVEEDLGEYIGADDARDARLRLLRRQLDYVRAVRDCFDDSQGRHCGTEIGSLHLTVDEARRWLTAERRNLREAVRFHVKSGETERRVLMELCELAGPPLLRIGYTRDAELFLSTAIRLSEELGDRRAEADSRRSLGGRVFRMFDRYSEAEHELALAMELYAELGDPEGEANSRCGLGHVARLREDWQTAAEHLERARQGYAALGLDRGEAECLLGLAEITVLRPDPDLDGAFELYRHAGRLFQDHNDLRGVAESYWGRAEVSRRKGELPVAARLYDAALDLARASHDQLVEADTLRGLGDLAAAEGHHAEALERFTAAVELYRHIMDQVGTADALAGQGETFLALGRRDEAAEALEESRKLYSGIRHSRAERVRRVLADNDLLPSEASSSWWRSRLRKERNGSG
ncbi:tetratricopeptide repeat protein [Glycomyces tarimensis]